jgi:hypothetical protein
MRYAAQESLTAMPAARMRLSWSLQLGRELPRTPAITISVVRLPERRRQEMMVIAALRRLDALQLVR